MKTTIKCCNCRKGLKKEDVYRTFYNERYYHNYHFTYRKGFHWCKECWIENETKNDQYKKDTDQQLLDEIKRDHPEIWKKLKTG